MSDISHTRHTFDTHGRLWRVTTQELLPTFRLPSLLHNGTNTGSGSRPPSAYSTRPRRDELWGNRFEKENQEVSQSEVVVCGAFSAMHPPLIQKDARGSEKLHNAHTRYGTEGLSYHSVCYTRTELKQAFYIHIHTHARIVLYSIV